MIPIPAVVFAIRFTDSQVAYELAIPIEGTPYYSVVSGIRGSMRHTGSEEEPTELISIETIVENLREQGIVLKGDRQYLKEVKE